MRCPDVYRRKVLGITACVTGFAGCIGESEKDLYFDEGDPFIGFADTDAFSGIGRIVPSCRDEAIEISITGGQPAEPIPYGREELGEECSFDISIDNEQAKSVYISGTEYGAINIDEDGEVTIAIEII